MAIPAVLVVEDEAIMASDLEQAVKALGYEVPGIALSGEEALAQMEEHAPDVVLMDIHLKGPMDGIEVAEQLRSTSKAPIIIYLTAYSDETTLERAQQTLPHGYITKPFQRSDLAIAIRMALARHQFDQSCLRNRSWVDTLVEHSPAATLALDEGGNIRLANEEALELAGCSREELVGLHHDEVFEIMDEAKGSRLSPCSKCLESGQPISPRGLVHVTGRGKDPVPVHFLLSPVKNQAGSVIGAVAVYRPLVSDLAQPTSRPRPPSLGTGLESIVGESPAMLQTNGLLRRIASSPSPTVLITGETGTGKDHSARAIHEMSTRRNGPFIHITCSALPETLLESELFGHERGAFTGAATQKKGLLEEASGGTVFLDEIGEMPVGLQAKLLRFLEEKVVRRVGGRNDLAVDVRVIAATNRNPEQDVEEGLFRRDLLYRLDVLRLKMPPLRHREGDITRLAQHFFERYRKEYEANLECLSAAALELLEGYSWPGNVRELKNAIERAILLAQGDCLEPKDFQLVGAVPASSTGSGYRLPEEGVSLDDVERNLVNQALERVDGNRTAAGHLLGLNRDQVRYRINKYGLAEFFEP